MKDEGLGLCGFNDAAIPHNERTECLVGISSFVIYVDS